MNNSLTNKAKAIFKSLFKKSDNNKENLLKILHATAKKNILDNNAFSMIEGVLKVQDLRATEVMIPKPQITLLEISMTLEEIVTIVCNSGHSRFPITSDNTDEILGILLAKDLLPFGYNLSKEQHSFDLKKILRPAVFIPESKRLDVLLQDFRINHNHMAIVVNEYGGVTGLITIEDVIEQIVGDIEDEYDLDNDDYIKQQSNNCFLVNALTPLDEFDNFFSTSLDSNKEVESIGGLVTRTIGYLPKKGELVEISGLKIKVMQADNRKIILLQISKS